MKMPWLMIPLLFLSDLCFAQSTSLQRWYPSKSRFPEGECVRWGTAPDGKEFEEKLKPEACRPAKTTPLWVNGGCYEVDEETQGQRYGRKQDAEACAPKDTLLSFDPKTRQCWVVDASTGGKQFKRPAKKDECRPSESELKKTFIPQSDRPVGGDCMEVHATLGEERWAKKLEPKDCRPAETNFAWFSTSKFQGQCWEVATTDSRLWSVPTRKENCRPPKVTYALKRTAGLSGECYEVDTDTLGERWSDKVELSKCREE